jgi:hypothetical protein
VLDGLERLAGHPDIVADPARVAPVAAVSNLVAVVSRERRVVLVNAEVGQ